MLYYNPMLRTYVINFISKVGLAVPFLYVFLSTLLNQSEVISAWPRIISKHINEDALIFLTALGALFLLIWMFSGKKKFESALTNTIILIIVTIYNPNLIFQLMPLIALALGLTLRYYPRIRVVAGTKISIPKENGGVHKTDDHDQHIFVPENK